MLPKIHRADKKDLGDVFKKGLFLTSPNLTFKYLPVPKTPFDTKISFIVPKTVSKSAVRRNFLRRKGYIELEKNLKLLSRPVVGAFVFKKIDLENLGNEIKSIFNKIR